MEGSDSGRRSTGPYSVFGMGWEEILKDRPIRGMESYEAPTYDVPSDSELSHWAIPAEERARELEELEQEESVMSLDEPDRVRVGPPQDLPVEDREGEELPLDLSWTGSMWGELPLDLAQRGRN